MLTLDGYNDTTALTANTNTSQTAPDTPLPSGIDTTLLNCLNSTIGAAAPLVDGALSRWARSGDGMAQLSLLWVLIWVVKTIL